VVPAGLGGTLSLSKVRSPVTLCSPTKGCRHTDKALRHNKESKLKELFPDLNLSFIVV